MRTETRTYYALSELPAAARERAMEIIGSRLAEWIESDELAEDMVESLGYHLGQHQGGEGQPLRGININEWSIDRNGRDYLHIQGTLTPITAPNLPWPDDCGYARFGRTNAEWTGNDRDLWLVDAETGEWMADDGREDVQAFWAALDDILAKALADGCAQYDYLCSEEYAREWAEANDPEWFDAEGELL